MICFLFSIDKNNIDYVIIMAGSLTFCQSMTIICFIQWNFTIQLRIRNVEVDSATERSQYSIFFQMYK